MNDQFERRWTERDWPWYVEVAVWEGLKSRPVRNDDLWSVPPRPSLASRLGDLFARLLRRRGHGLVVVKGERTSAEDRTPIERVA